MKARFIHRTKRKRCSGTCRRVTIFTFSHGGSRTLEEPDELGPNLFEIAARPLRCTQAGALDVIYAVVAGQPPRDMVAGGAILGEPVVTKIKKGDLPRGLIQRVLRHSITIDQNVQYYLSCHCNSEDQALNREK